MKWMEFFLEDGQMAGRIICPNKKCGAKLGNYDWAGVCCSCKEWVTPVSFVFPSFTIDYITHRLCSRAFAYTDRKSTKLFEL